MRERGEVRGRKADKEKEPRGFIHPEITETSAQSNSITAPGQLDLSSSGQGHVPHYLKRCEPKKTFQSLTYFYNLKATRLL